MLTRVAPPTSHELPSLMERRKSRTEISNTQADHSGDALMEGVGRVLKDAAGAAARDELEQDQQRHHDARAEDALPAHSLQ